MHSAALDTHACALACSHRLTYESVWKRPKELYLFLTGGGTVHDSDDGYRALSTRQSSTWHDGTECTSTRTEWNMQASRYAITVRRSRACIQDCAAHINIINTSYLPVVPRSCATRMCRLQKSVADDCEKNVLHLSKPFPAKRWRTKPFISKRFASFN